MSIAKLKIDAKLVQELRKITDSGMMDCKRALEATQGDLTKAIEFLRKSGQAKAEKKASRVAGEGIIVIQVSSDHQQAVILETNCETDFVAKEKQFTEFATQSAQLALTNNISDIAVLETHQATARQALVAKLGENMTFRRLKLIKNSSPTDYIASYMHMGGRIGVIFQVSGATTEIQKNLARDIAMHIAAMRPQAMVKSDLDPVLIQKETDIYQAKVQSEFPDKPAAMHERIVAGYLDKWMQEIVLLDQFFVKENKSTIGQVLKKNNLTPIQFLRFEVGEGIEKEKVDFATEVMSQTKAFQS